MKIMKRILAFVLCICMVVACWPAEKLNATGTTDIASYYLNEQKTTVYTSDYFSTETKYEEALGEYDGHSYAIPWATEGLVSASGAKNAIFDGVLQNYVSNLQNYTVTADVVTTQTTGNVAVMAYSRSAGANTSNSYGYEFNIIGTANGQTFRLNRRLNSTVYTFAPTAGKNDGVAVTEFFPNYTPGETITMSISAVTNEEGNIVLNCTATIDGVTKTVFENITDDTDAKVTAGAPGLKINKTDAVVKNISVFNNKEVCLYEDDFSSQTNYENALGNQVGHAYGASWTDRGLVSESGAKNAIFNGVLKNYTVSADVVTTQTTGNVAIMAYSRSAGANTSNSYGYEFNILGTANGQTFRLNRRLVSTVYTFAPTAGNNNGVAVTEYFPNYTPGQKINMSINATTSAEGNVVLNCYATFNGERKVIFENIVDNTDGKVLMGAPGLKINKPDAMVSNVTVVTQESEADCLYKDDFSSANGYIEALGDYNGTKFAYGPGYLTKGVDNTWESKFNGIKDSATLENYTISADMSYGFGAGKYHRITAYGGKGTGYEFGLIKDNTKGASFSLYRRSSSASSFDGAKAISDYFTADDGSFENDVFRLGMTVKTESDGVHINCSVTYNGETKEIFNVVDNSENKITCGAPGVRSNDNINANEVKVDNICVTKVASITPAPGPNPDPGPTPDPEPQPIEITIPFAETFDRTRDELGDYWNNGKDVTIQNVNGNNQLVLGGSIKNLYLTGDKDTLDWTNYVYEADVVMTDEDDVERDQSFASIIAAVNGENKGYEFSLMYVKSKDKCYVRLYDRIHATAIASPAFDFEFGEAVRLKMEVTEDVIKCYANGELMVTASNLNNLKGTIGMSILGKYARFDNVSVTEYINVNPNPQPQPVEITIPFTEMFEGAKETLSSYWNKGTTVTIETEDGNNQAVLDGTETSMYLTGDKDTLDWSNYAYEADVTMTEQEFNSNVDNTMATIVAAANESNKGYEFSLMYVKSKDAYYVRLYDRIHGKIIRTPRFDFEFGVPVVLRMEVTEDTIKCYANGELMITATDLEELSGTIGIVAAGRTAKFDNLSVIKYVEEKVTAPVANSEGIYYQDNFSNAVNIEDNKWNEPILNILNEQAIVSGDKGLLYLAGDEGYLTLKDYTVSAKVMVGTENDSYARTIVGAIVARSEGESTGYELGIIHTGDSSYVRLYDRTAGKELAKNTDVAFEMGKEYILTMVCDGEQITCYVDGINVFTVKDGTNKAGTAGLRTIGTVYYDDFVVATPAYASRFVSYAPIISSPATGDMNWNRMPLYVAMFVTAGVLVGLEVVDLKRRKRAIPD